MKKGQVQQVFIYLMVIIVVGAIILIGANLIDGLINQGCDVEKVKFEKNLQKALSSNKAYLSMEQVELKAPCKADQICFADKDTTVGLHNNDVIKQTVNAGSDTNIFLITGSITEPLMAFDGLTTDNKLICINVTGSRIHFKAEGADGGLVRVSYAE